MQKAYLYEKLDDKNVRCLACKNYCVIPSGKSWICRVRKNIDWELHLIVHSNAAALNIDPVEKKPLYHFLPETNTFSIWTVGCNFGCEFCQNWEIAQISKTFQWELDSYIDDFWYYLTPFQIIDYCKKENIQSISYTYNEPIIFFEYIYDIMKQWEGVLIKHVLVTNWYESPEALEKLAPYVSAMNIDLKSFRNNFYKKVCKADLNKVLDTIKRVYELGIWVEITTLVIPEHNDTEEELNSIAEFVANVDINIPWHISAFRPDNNMNTIPPTPYSTLQKAVELWNKNNLRYIYLGNVVDSENSSTWCHNCGELLIKREWMLTKKQKNFENWMCKNCWTIVPGVWK